MGNSKPPRANIDLINSYARVVDDEVEIVLNDPDFEVPPGSVVVLRKGDRRRRAEATLEETAHGRQLVARIPRGRVGNGQWVLRFRSDQHTMGLGTRLLVQRNRPVVLLWGAKPLPSHLPVPHQRKVESGGRAARVRRRALSAVSRVQRVVTQPARRSS